VSATIRVPASNSRGISPRSASREAVLAALFDPERLPTPPAVALQVVNAASQPDCNPTEIVNILGRDPALCGKLLKAVNSCLYGLSKPVASVARAVTVLGLNTVRSLALGLSMPAVRPGSVPDGAVRDYWVSSVGGAIFARELAVLVRRPNPEDDLVAGLLRDLGEVLLRLTFPNDWAEHVARNGDRLLDDPCPAEQESFGITHAEVSAELLRGWKLPDDIVEPIRHHHDPSRIPAADKARHGRAELLEFAHYLVNIDAVVQNPALVERVLATARARYGLPHAALVEFLRRVAPKVEAFATVLNQDLGQCPDFAAVLAAGARELVNLTVETNRSRLSGPAQAAATMRAAADAELARTIPVLYNPTQAADPADRLPEFRPEFAEKLPDSGCRLGEYELRQLLGRGAMGLVFKAYEPSLDRFVAVKLLAPELAAIPAARQRFAREARVAAAIQHENVVGIYAVREVADASYLAMEYVRGSCLESWTEDNGLPPVPLVVGVARQIAAGLAAAHARQIVHRDIKPANILIEAQTNRVKLSDFGLARVADNAALTTDGTLIGTPLFMAPEVIQGEPATALSDLYSLGGVFYALATGCPPFRGINVAAVSNAVCSHEPTPPSRLRPDLPAWLEAVILRLLRKKPAERFPDAAAVVVALAEHA
jgi:HD-like signal output (HDOD) protein